MEYFVLNPMPELPSETDLGNMPETVRDYFRARANGDLRVFYSERLSSLRELYSDDLPAEKVHKLATLDGEGQFGGSMMYKCRGNYVFMLMTTLKLAVSDGIVTDPEVVAMIEVLSGYDWSYQRGELTTPSEVQLVNQLLGLAINNLG